jgi:Spy/CpxP family protein refolding chaperone
MMLWLSLALLGAQSPPGVVGRWWRDPSIQHDLALTPSQVRRLETIFERDLPARIAMHEKIRRMDADLLRVIGNEDEGRVRQFIDDLEALRQRQNTRRALMLLEMYRTLTPRQRLTLAAIFPSRAHHRSSITRR